MTSLFEAVRGRLEAGLAAGSLTRLFCDDLCWGAPQGLTRREIQAGLAEGTPAALTPVAQLSGLPVYRVDWPESRLPTVTARRTVQKALSPVHAQHLLCYVTRDGRQVAFTWARTRPDGKTELRTLPYEVGTPARTTIERLAELAFGLDELGLFGEPPITTVTDKLNRAFSVEAVTKQFYREIADWYFWARDSEGVVTPKDVRTAEDRALFLIRLLTRLIFCWFLRKKRDTQMGQGLLPPELFDEKEIVQLLKDASPNACTYYPAILQNLFFATLNTEMDRPGELSNRRFLDPNDGWQSDDHMIHTLWRNARLLREPDRLASLLRRVPFLNGGLFECLDDRVQRGDSDSTEEVRIDGFSDKPEKHPRLPNYLFFGMGRVMDLSEAYGDLAHRRENVRPLLEILSSYNFTLNENTPLEQEVALDPELLGHVFENLLAAYNPETGTVARKATGSFYTPRVVVDWMVDEALTVYLRGSLSQDAASTADENGRRLKSLLSWDDSVPQVSADEVEALIDAIDRMRVIDPACGSGAFPMGMLQKLVHVLRKLDPENRGWRRRQEEAVGRIESATAREEALLAIERAFARDNDDYGRKLYLIENCLYGVDIQPIACQLAKLRFFIALMVDQDVDLSLPNYGILPLPNLETKIVAADTLLGLARGQIQFVDERVRRLEVELKQVRHDYFTARRYRDKKALRARDKDLCEALADVLAESGDYAPGDTQRIAHWNPYNTQVAASFFDPGWMFGLHEDGLDGGGPFDIAIGNPPYVRQEQLRNVSVTGSDGRPNPLKDVLREQYECYTGTADLYVYFFERAIRLLRVGGTLSFVTSNKYMRAAYGEKLRAYLVYATRPHAILDFGDTPVFTSIAYPCIVVAQKTRHVVKGGLPLGPGLDDALAETDHQLPVLTWAPGHEVGDFPEIFDTESHRLAQQDLKPGGWRLESPVGLRLVERLAMTGRPLRAVVGSRVYRGVTTGLNDAFVVDRATRDRLVAEHPSSGDVLKSFLRGRDAKRWRCEFQDLWLVFTRRGIRISEYPAILEYLGAFEARLTPGVPGGRKPGNYRWYEIQDSVDYWSEFERAKIISTKVSVRPTFAMDTRGSYLGNTSYFLTPGAMALYLLAVLNSRLSEGYARRRFVEKQGGWYEVQPDGLEAFPVPAAAPEQQYWCERLAETLVWLHGPGGTEGAGVAPLALMKAYFEQWLDGLVYELFFPEELHARKLRLFDETARIAPADLSGLSDPEKLTNLRDVFEAAYDSNAVLRAMLFDLRSLEVVRIVEEPLGHDTDVEDAGT